MSSITFRVPEELKGSLETLCSSTQRTQSYHIKEALSEYLERETWQVSVIQDRIKEADAGHFATEEEMHVLKKKWGYNGN